MMVKQLRLNITGKSTAQYSITYKTQISIHVNKWKMKSEI